MNKNLLRVAALLLVGFAASGCSSIPDWVDPSTWIGDDSNVATSAPPPDTSDEGQTVAEASDNGQQQYPDLANAPQKPAAPSTTQEQTQVADQLSADRSHAQYTGDALRGGTEPAAAPPPPPGAEPQIQTADNSSADDQSGSSADQSAQASSDQSAGDQSASSQAANTQASAPAPSDSSSDTVNSAAVAAGDNSAASAPAPAAQPAVTADNSTTDQSASAPSEAPTTQVASTNMSPPPGSSGAEPAVPAVPPASAGMQPMLLADAPLGFKPSSAPALSPDVSQFVAAPVFARYQQTASDAGVATNTIVPASYSGGDTTVALNAPRGASRAQMQSGSSDVGGPETMSGSVVASFDALNGSAAPAAPSAYANAYGTPSAVVYFPNDVAAIGPQGHAQIELAVQAWKAQGGQGYIRVVGHSSSRTGNMPVEKHLELIFSRSQAYANAVARALIGAGVPANKVLVEAVGDSQPVYYESMPQGETGNRRAEIFVQG